MPRMNGSQLVERVMAQGRPLKMALATGFAEKIEGAAAQLLLAKPFGQEELYLFPDRHAEGRLSLSAGTRRCRPGFAPELDEDEGGGQQGQEADAEDAEGVEQCLPLLHAHEQRQAGEQQAYRVAQAAAAASSRRIRQGTRATIPASIKGTAIAVVKVRLPGTLGRDGVRNSTQRTNKPMITTPATKPR